MKEKQINEFVVLEKDGMDAFRSHLEEVGKAAKGGSPVSGRQSTRNLLVLAYPTPGMDQMEFNEFFASPDNVNPRTDGFRGCFAVELTDYKFSPDNSRIADLSGYMRDHEDMSFVLFAVDDGQGCIGALAESAAKIMGCRIGRATQQGIEWDCGFEQKSRAFGY